MKKVERFWPGWFLLFLVILLGIMIGYMAYLAIDMEHIEGTIIDKYIDTESTDTYKFIIEKDDGKNYIAQVTIDQYYSYEIGEWFSGDVYWIDDPESWWD